MKKTDKFIKIGKVLRDILEILTPVILFVVLFLAFLLGVWYRYFLKDPRSWTFEVSTICYLAVGVLSWGLAHREGSDVVFEMFYERLLPSTRCVLRIVGNALTAVVAISLIWPSITYMQSMAGLVTQIIEIPRFIVFLPFTISFVSAAVRNTYYVYLDIQSFRNRDYEQKYAVKKEVDA